MMLSWKKFLLSHPDNDEYNKIADEIQLLIDTNNKAENNFRTITEHPSLILLSKSCSGKEVQASFNHSIKKTKLIGGENEYLALLGFGPRACPMKIDIKEIFSVSKEKKSPSFEQIMSCRNEDDVKNLKPVADMKSTDLEAQALIPPFLLKVLLSLDDFDAVNVLLAFLKAIRKQRWLLSSSDSEDDTSVSKEPNQDPQDNVSESFENIEETEFESFREGQKPPARPTLTRAVTNAQLTNDNQTNQNPEIQVEAEQEINSIQANQDEDSIFDTNDQFFSQRYYRIILFLWSIVHYDGRTIKATKISPCCRHSTLEWSEQVHSSCLNQGPSKLPPLPNLQIPNSGNPPVHGGETSATIAITKFAAVLQEKVAADSKKEAEREKSKESKSFESLSEVQQNIFILITAKGDESDIDVDKMEPTDSVKKILKHKISTKTQAQLQHDFRAAGNMCDISIAFCTNLKNGIIASHPTPKDINGLSPFFLPDQAEDERLGQDLALRLTEQLSLGKINESDLRAITKCRYHFPKNVGEYIHYVRNFHHMLVLLSGPESFISSSIGLVVDHVRENEKAYKDLERVHWFFYASVLFFLHKRCQMYIHSASLGKISQLKKKKLEFDLLLESIEDGDYQPTLPNWLKNKKRDLDREQNSNGHHNNRQGGGGGGAPAKRQRIESIDNPNQVTCLKIPPDTPYRFLFHPNNRRNIEAPTHRDGTVMCNNWIHRGWCSPTCDKKASHGKTLSEEEIQLRKSYLEKLVTKFKEFRNRRNNRNNPTNEG